MIVPGESSHHILHFHQGSEEARVDPYEFTGERLKQLLDDGRRNKNGFLQTSYLKLHLNSKGNVETITDCRTNKIIRDNDKCIVVLDAFITSGGDGYDSKLFSGYEIGDFIKTWR